MTAAPRVTVTVNSYHHAAFIGSCLASARVQRCDFPTFDGSKLELRLEERT